MFEVREIEGTHGFDSHEQAWNSGHKVFRDSEYKVLIITDDGWVSKNFISAVKDYARYPVTPLPNNQALVVR